MELIVLLTVRTYIMYGGTDMEIGHIISKRRKELGMTQQQLADQLFVTVQAVSKWETGAGNPDIHMLPQISKIIKIDIDDLFENESNQDITDIIPLRIRDPIAERYISYRKWIILIGFIFLLVFLFFGFLYTERLSIPLIGYYTWNRQIYGGFLVSGVIFIIIIKHLTMPSPQSSQVESPERIKERKDTRIISTFPLIGFIGSYLYFSIRFHDLNSLYIEQGLSGFLIYSQAFIYYLLPTAIPFFLVYHGRMNQPFVLLLSIISVFIVCQYISVEVIQVVFVFMGTVLTFIWGIRIVSRMITQFMEHIDRARILFLPFDFIFILVAFLSTVLLFAGFFTVFGLSEFNLSYDSLPYFPYYSILYITLYLASLLCLSLERLFGRFLKKSDLLVDKKGKFTLWHIRNRTILGFAFLILLVSGYIILKYRFDLSRFDSTIIIGFVSFAASIIYDALLGPIIR